MALTSEVNQAASLDDEGIGVKIDGFAKFSSPKKHNGAAGLDDEGYDGFSKFVDKKKRNLSVIVGKDGFQDDSQDEIKKAKSTKTTTEKAGYSDQFVGKKKRNLSAIVGKDGFKDDSQDGIKKAKSTKTTTEKAGYSDQVVGKKLRNLSAIKGKDGYASNSQGRIKEVIDFTKTTADKAVNSNQTRMRRLRTNDEKISSQSAQRLNVQSGPQSPTQSRHQMQSKSGKQLQYGQAHPGQGVSPQSGQSSKAPSVQLVPTISRQHIRAHSERGREQDSPVDQSQSRLQSPMQSRHGPSQSGQSMPTPSLQLSAQSRQRTPEAQSRQNATVVQSNPSSRNILSTTDGNDKVCWKIGSTSGDGRMRVEVINGVLEPSYDCSARIRKILYQELEPTGYNWKAISQLTKKFYFDEFKKYFVWRQSDAIIYSGWLANARKKYSELVCVAHGDWEKHKKPDNRIGMNAYLSWVEFWKTSPFQTKSKIQKSNRRSGVDGQFSTHTSGSASHRTVAARMKIQLKRDPTADELFRETHIRHLKKNKNLIGGDDGNCLEDDNNVDEEEEILWIDKKSQQTYETFANLCEQQKESGQPVDKNALFLNAVGGPDKRNRVYGVGSSQSNFYRSATMPCTSTVDEENEQLKNKLAEMNERMKAMEYQMAKFIQANSVQDPQDLDLDSENDDN